MKPEVTLKYLSYIRNKKQANNEGFTLIELLVVVIIIGILAAVALPNLLGQAGKARIAEAKSNAGAINRAQQGYFIENQTFAGNTTDLGVAIGTSDWYNNPTITGGAGPATAVFGTTAKGATGGAKTVTGTVTHTSGTFTTAVTVGS